MADLTRWSRICLLAALVALPGCSVKRMAINSLADTLAASGDVFASDDDPELVRDAVPFSLKTIETLLDSVPDHPGLLLSACSGFTQYAYAFVQADAERLEETDYEAAGRARDRALNMYLRARGYCFRRLEVRQRGLTARLVTDAAGALSPMRADDVPALYWTAAAWGAAVSLGLDRPELVADLPIVRQMAARALALQEDYARGAIHEMMISLEGLPEAMGGSPERARRHFARAVELQKGASAGPYVTLATSVAQPAQDKAQFRTLLEQALAIDPDADKSTRLANILAQRRARWLLDRIDEIFGDAESSGST
jgi:predicted anti-sigma-YlaC factor YlaD